jgi:general secretion pathway protein C
MTSVLSQTVAGVAKRLMRYWRHAPHVICAAFAIACVTDVALLARSLARGHIARGVSPEDYPQPRSRASSEVSRIVEGHLFGPPDAAASAGATDASLVLTGVLADSEDAQRGGAILGSSVQSVRYVAAGGTISQGLVLKLVYSDHVIMIRDGSSELLRLRGSGTRSSSSMETAAAAQTPDAGESAATDGLPTVEELTAKIAVQDQRLAEIFHAAGNFDDDRFHGVTIQPGAHPELLASIGLRPGDMITDVDHVPITDPSVLQQFASGRTIGVGVRRPDGTERVEIDTSLLRGYIGN